MEWGGFGFPLSFAELAWETLRNTAINSAISAGNNEILLPIALISQSVFHPFFFHILMLFGKNSWRVITFATLCPNQKKCIY